MKQKDYYAILNVSRDASEDEIRKAYRKLALKYHPDKNPGDKTTETKFREITEAYDLLQNTVERKHYDQLNLPKRGRNLEYHLEVSLKNGTDDKQGVLKEVTFEAKGRKIRLVLDKGDGTYRLRGMGKAGSYGGYPGDLFVVVNAKQQLPQTLFGNDGAEMMLIPAGDFLMGSEDKNARDDEKPVHSVYLDAFYVDKYLATNAQYKKFIDENPMWSKDGFSKGIISIFYLTDWSGNTYPDRKADHPVISVPWCAAMAYAQWAGKRLLTEAEWEKATRGNLVCGTYPWGNSIDPNKANYGKNVRNTTPVGNYPANGYGLYDMVGNVNEWCFDGYDADFYTHAPRKNPFLDEKRTLIIGNVTYNNCRVLRGGSWVSPVQHVRVSSRQWSKASMGTPFTGFRCAKSVTF